MRIVHANGTVTIVTDIDAKDLNEPQKIYDKHGNEVYQIRKAIKGETGGFNKVSAVLNGVVNGKAAFIMVTPEDFDYAQFKAANTAAMNMFYEAEKTIVEGLAIYKSRAERMWEELEGTTDCACASCCEGSVPTIPAEPVDDDTEGDIEE